MSECECRPPPSAFPSSRQLRSDAPSDDGVSVPTREGRDDDDVVGVSVGGEEMKSSEGRKERTKREEEGRKEGPTCACCVPELQHAAREQRE